MKADPRRTDRGISRRKVAANILPVGARTRNQERVRSHLPGRRQGVQLFTTKGAPLRRSLNVDDRSGSCDDNRFCERPDREFHRDSCNSTFVYLDVLSFHRGETRKRKGGRVRAGTQIDEPELALATRDRRPHPFNQRGAGHFDRDARQHSLSSIRDRSTKGAPLRRSLNVDDRSGSCDDNRFCERPDREFHRDSCNSTFVYLDVLSFHRGETRKRKGGRVRAGTQIDEPELALATRDRRPHPFNQRGAGHFDRDARQHSLSSIRDRSSNAARLTPSRPCRKENSCNDQPAERRG